MSDTILPLGWKRGVISDIAEVNPSVHLNGTSGDTPVSFIAMADVTETARVANRQVRQLREVILGFTRFQEGDVLFAKITPCMQNGKGAWAKNLVNGFGFGSTEFHVLRANQDGDPEFVYHLVSSAELRIKAESFFSGSAGQQRVSSDFFKKYEIVIPPTKAQRMIARILTTIDNQIEKTAALIAKYEAIKQGMMHDLFTRGVNKNGRLRPPQSQAPHLYKQSPLGWIPKEWEFRRLGELADAKGGKRLPAGSDFSDSPTPYPYIRVVDMKNGTVDDSALKYVPPDIQRMIQNYTISSDDLYVTIAGTLGLFGRIPSSLDGAQLTENAAKLVFHDPKHTNLDFMCFFLNSDQMKVQLFAEMGLGAGVPKLALFRIVKMMIKYPPLEEQRRIAERLLSVGRKSKEETSFLEELKDLKQSLMQDLLTGKVAVLPDESDSSVHAKEEADDQLAATVS